MNIRFNLWKVLENCQRMKYNERMNQKIEWNVMSGWINEWVKYYTVNEWIEWNIMNEWINEM